MDLNFFLFLKGFVIGFLINAPVGPIGILCIRRSFTEGRALGFVSGLGVATVDALYGVVAAFGLTFISNFLIHQQLWIRLLGGFLLLGLGIKILRVRSAKEVALPTATGLLAATVIPFALVLKQPDLGTALIIAGIYGVMLFVAGVELRLFGWIVGGGLALAGTLFALHAARVVNVLGVLHDYQLRRLQVLFYPDLDPLGAGYHINQSKIAIGSGGLAGKGFLQGAQSSLNFLPQQHTDFIFSVVSEEWGFVGATLVILLMVALVYWAVNTARRARDFAGGLFAMGVATIFFLHCAINIGMTTGFFPVVGLPLPPLSYGGSSVLTTFAGIGLIMNVRMRRFLFK